MKQYLRTILYILTIPYSIIACMVVRYRRPKLMPLSGTCSMETNKPLWKKFAIKNFNEKIKSTISLWKSSS